MSDNSMSSSVHRILFKEIVPGDLRKIEAQSNDSPTGGGARDFRFGSYDNLVPVIQQMFPDSVVEERKRNGSLQQIQIHMGRFYWVDSHTGSVTSAPSYFESPTDVRPSEGRIARVHEYPCFDTSLIPRGGAGNRVVLLFIQLSDGTVWPYFTEEKALRTPGLWHVSVADVVIQCLDAHRPPNHSAIGFYDFVNGTRYCNGR